MDFSSTHVMLFQMTSAKISEQQSNIRISVDIRVGFFEKNNSHRYYTHCDNRINSFKGTEEAEVKDGRVRRKLNY